MWTEDSMWKASNKKILKNKIKEIWKRSHQVEENCQMNGQVSSEGWQDFVNSKAKWKHWLTLQVEECVTDQVRKILGTSKYTSPKEESKTKFFKTKSEMKWLQYWADLNSDPINICWASISTHHMAFCHVEEAYSLYFSRPIEIYLSEQSRGHWF